MNIYSVNRHTNNIRCETITNKLSRARRPESQPGTSPTAAFTKFNRGPVLATPQAPSHQDRRLPQAYHRQLTALTPIHAGFGYLLTVREMPNVGGDLSYIEGFRSTVFEIGPHAGRSRAQPGDNP